MRIVCDVVNYDKTQDNGGLLGGFSGILDQFKASKSINANTQDFIRYFSSSGQFWSTESIDNYAKACGDLDESIVKLAKDFAGISYNRQAFETSLQNLPAYAGKATVAFRTLGKQITAMAINMGTVFLINAAINGIIKLVDKLIVTTEEQVEKVNKLQEAYDELQSEYDKLSSKQNLSEAEEARLAYLEKRLELDKEILKYENKIRAEKETATANDGWDNLKGLFTKDSMQRTLLSSFFDVYGINSQYADFEDAFKAYENAVDDFNKRVGVSSDRVQRDFEEALNVRQTNLQEILPKLQEQLSVYYQALDTQLQNVQYLDGKEKTDAENYIKLLKFNIRRYETLEQDIKNALGLFDDNEEEIQDKLEEAVQNLTFDQVLELKISPEGIDFQKIRTELVRMAQAGTLDESSLRSYEHFDEILKAIGKSADISDDELSDFIKTVESMSTDNAVDNVNSYTELLSGLEDAYLLFKQGKIIDEKTLSTMQTQFAQLGGDAWKAFEDAVLSGEKDLQEYFNNLATEISVFNPEGAYVLDNLTEANRGTIETWLKSAGVINANEVVEEQLKHTQEMHIRVLESLSEANENLQDNGLQNTIIGTEELESATFQNIAALVQEANASTDATEALSLFALQKMKASDYDLNNPSDLQYLISLTAGAGASTKALIKLAKVKEQIANLELDRDKSYADMEKALTNDERARITERNRDISKQLQSLYDQVDQVTADADAEIQDAINKAKDKYRIDVQYKYDGGDDVKKSLADAKDSTEKEFDELFDFFERRVEVLSQSIELLGKELENVVGSAAKNQLLDAQRGIYQEEIRNYEDAAQMYQEMADAYYAKVPDEFKDKIKDGAVAIEEFMGEASEETLDAIKSYQEWANKVNDCTQQLAELKETLRQLELSKFNNIVQDFTEQFDLLQSHGIDMIQKQMDLFSESGEVLGVGFYKTQQDITNKQIALLEKEKQALVTQLNSAIANGVNAASDEWVEMINQLNDVDASILDAKKSIEELDNAILNLHVENFERIQTALNSLNSTLSSIVGLVDDLDVATEDNKWTAEGLTQLGALAQQYEIAQRQVQQYNEEITELNNQYLAGKYSATEYSERLQQLTSEQWSAVESSESALDSIMALNEARINIVVEGINKEIEAFKELTDAQIKQLEAEKDLHDYQNSIAESNKNITALERQIAAMSNDTSAATVAKRKKLEQQLADARSDLAEKEYDHNIETQKETLQEQYDNYEKARQEEIEALEATLKDRENIYAQSFEAVRQNAAVIGQSINDLANKHGVEISQSLTNAWKSGENAIAAYGTTLNASSDVFMQDIYNVENQVWDLQVQADATANQLAAMFATKADTLVYELQASYDSATNLLGVSIALRNSFVNALERGYDISNIVNNLKSIENAANAAAAAVARAGAQPSTSGSTQTPQDTNEKAKQQAEQQAKSAAAKAAIQAQEAAKKLENAVTNAVTTAYELKHGKKSGSTIAIYGSGKRKIPHDQLAITQDAGPEMLRLADGSLLTPLTKGSTVFNNAMTENLWAWGKINPAEVLTRAITSNLPKSTSIGNTVNYHFDSMVNVEGNVNDSMAMMQTATAAAQKNFESNWRELNKGLNH